MAEWSEAHSFQSVFEFLQEKHDRPGAIKRACKVVEDSLISNKDNPRGFFEHCFPLLLKRIFGYDDKEASWLHIVAVDGRDADATALIQLLAPTGPLLVALHGADGESIIQFMFPPERLPAHTQVRLPAGCDASSTAVHAGNCSGAVALACRPVELDGWPQYHGRLRLDGVGRCQVHLNMFQYFMFWAAFYVLRGSSSSSSSSDKTGKGSSSSSGRARASIIPQRAHKLWSAGSSAAAGPNSHHPYFRLLRLYLEHYLPRPPGVSPIGAGSGSRGMLGARSSTAGGLGAAGRAGLGGLGSSTGGAFAGSLLAAGPGDVLLSVLLEFWLTDAGEPLPAEPQAVQASRAGSPTGNIMPGTAAAANSSMAAAAAAAAAGAGGWGGAQAGLAGQSGPGGLGVSGPGAAGLTGLAGPGGLTGAQAGGLVNPLGQHGLMMGGGAGPAGAAGGMGGMVGAGMSSGGGYAAAAGLLGVAAGGDRLGVGLAGAGAAGAGVLPAGTSGGPLHTYSYQPPAEDLVQALSLLAKYVFVGEPPGSDGQPIPAQSGTKWLPSSPVATLPLPAGRLALPHQPSPIMAAPAFSPAVQAVSRKLYRLLRRTFAQWQPSSSANLAPIVKLWLVVLAPWKAVTYADTAKLRQSVDSLAAAQPGSRGRAGGGAGSSGSSSSIVLGGAAGAVLRGAAGSAAGLVGAAGGGGLANGQQHRLFGGAGQVAASAAANLNRWGSEMAHHLAGAGQDGLERDGEEQRESRNAQNQQYSPAWRSHVLAHLPFYTQLLPAFLELTYSQMAYSARPAIKESYRVLKCLAESGPELLAELQAAEAAYNRYVGSSARRPEGDLAELLPWLADQAQDWESAAAAGAPTTPPLTPDTSYRLFTLEQGGAASCMRALLAAADRQNFPSRVRLREMVEAVLPLAELPSEEAAAITHAVAGRDLPKAGCWRDVRYQGDWMLRPIASNEVAPLVRLLVGVSRAVNSTLGLTGVPAAPGEGPPETVTQELLGVARRRGWRLNLRPLAEVQTLAWLLGLLLVGRWLWMLASSQLASSQLASSSQGGLLGLDDDYYAELAAGQQHQQQHPQYAGVAGVDYQQQRQQHETALADHVIPRLPDVTQIPDDSWPGWEPVLQVLQVDTSNEAVVRETVARCQTMLQSLLQDAMTAQSLPPATAAADASGRHTGGSSPSRCSSSPRSRSCRPRCSRCWSSARQRGSSHSFAAAADAAGGFCR
ncbi:hypothetical protein COO60DRAFT_1699160 [Scenedesmus sp. NREL 46B-D3]|nr:hypothetical protein COO60DRAFT_1699160 [Scenedesmus sp. NREL 46B-D3]